MASLLPSTKLAPKNKNCAENYISVLSNSVSSGTKERLFATATRTRQKSKPLPINHLQQNMMRGTRLARLLQ
jgi:hypothetical protein